MKLIAIILFFVMLSACSKGPHSPRGFSLPEGDSDRGELVFMAYDCLACHSLEGYTDQGLSKELSTVVKLGGDVTRVKTYAELLTSVINPSHKIAEGYAKKQVRDDQGESKMRNYNDLMTVSELVDLIAFLQPHYQLVPYERTNYPTYYP